MRLLAAFVVAVLSAGGWYGSAVAGAADLGDYLWRSRPLLLFAPIPDDPRLTETLSRIRSSRCAFADRDMVTGLVVARGDSTLDGQPVGPDEAQRLRTQFAVDPDAFAAILIGKDGGEKWRADDVPDLQTIYAVIDGMPMRGREARSGRC
jgi:hypothetical protein